MTKFISPHQAPCGCSYTSRTTLRSQFRRNIV